MRKSFIDQGHPQLSLRRQATLLRVNRNRLVALDRKPSAEDLLLCREIDEIHMRLPFYGSRRMVRELRSRGFAAGRGRVRRLMRWMGLTATYPKPKTSKKAPGHKIYPYLLRDLKVDRPNQAWCADITYIPMGRGFAYLVAIMDWHSRAVLGWKISNTLDSDFCVSALLQAREVAGTWPEIMNTDQGCQFTSAAWTDVLHEADVQISMDGRGRWIDNVFVERLWWSLKYEDIYLHEYLDLVHLESGVTKWMSFYNHERRHQSLGYMTPWSVWLGEAQHAA
jgi:putative transposase